MKRLPVKTLTILFGALLFSNGILYAQQDSVKTIPLGYVTVNQSPEIDKLLNLKKDISVEEERFKIQIYSGSRSAAEAAKANFDEAFPQHYSRLEYETPNYKIWIGNFRSRLEADRALLKVKRKFTSAFIFKPGK